MCDDIMLHESGGKQIACRSHRRSDERSLARETRLGDLPDDLEPMLKRELLGSCAHFETVYECKLGALAERLTALEGG
jgi:hypothetical protein